MFTSLILDARISGARLPRQLGALQRIARNHGGRIELLVADDSGDPRLPELIQRHGARLCRCAGTPLGDRLNTAVAYSQGDVLVFPAPDQRLPAHWFQRMVEHIEQQQWNVAVLSSHSSGRLANLRRRLTRRSSVDTLCVSHVWFERIGGFDPALDLEALPDLLERLRACQARVEMSYL